MQKSTKLKIMEIQKMLDSGIDEKEIIKAKFKSSPKAYNEWIDKWGSYLKMELPVQKNNNIESNELVFIPTENDIIKLKKLLENTDDLIALLNKEEKIEEINILQVPEELLKLKDIKISSVRISENIEKQFNDLVAKNKLYSKTALMNMALLEFIDKYK
ncbi:MAG: hypothetical protein ACRC4T_15575 [Cetobacterium sp.]